MTAPTSRVPVPGAPPGSGLAFPNGASTIRGFEISLNGYVTDYWQSQLGYAYTDARIAKDLTATNAALPILAGNRVQLVPYNQIAWWNKFKFTDMWSAGVGVIYFSDSFATSDDTVRLPGFVRVDAGLYANFDQLESAAHGREHLQYELLGLGRRRQQHFAGAGRTVRVKAIYKF